MYDPRETPRTTRDALVAEMLGDIGRLHNSVEKLKCTLPADIADAERRIQQATFNLRKELKLAAELISENSERFKQDQEVAISRMDFAANFLGEQAKDFTIAELERAKSFSQNYLNHALKNIAETATEARIKIEEKAVESVKHKIESEVTEIINEFRLEASRLKKQNIFIFLACILSGVVCTAIAVGVNSKADVYIVDQKAEAINSAIKKLDPDAREKFISEFISRQRGNN